MRLLAVLLVCALLAGCAQPQAKPTPNVTTSPTSTSPTSTPSATPGPSPTPTPSPFPPAVGSDGAWHLSECAVGASEARAPDLLVGLGPDGVVARFSEVDGRYVETERSGARLVVPAYGSSRVPLESSPHGAYLFGTTDNGTALLHLGSDLAVARSAEVPQGADILAQDGRIYVSSDHLEVFDEDLNSLGRIELPLKEWGGNKAAHDVLVHDGVAYLLDDVVIPLYVLRVDVRDPARMEVLERIQIDGGHLAAHWVDPEADRWLMLNEWGGRGGTSTTLIALPLQGGPPVERFATYANQRSFTDPEAPMNVTGYEIEALLDGPPQWVVAQNQGNATIGRLDVDLDEERVRLCEIPVDLPAAMHAPATIDRQGSWIVASWNSMVVVLDATTEPPGLVLVQDLGQPMMALTIVE